MTDAPAPARPRPARPRRAGRRRRAASPRDAGRASAVLAAGGLGGRRGDRDQRGAGRRPAQRLRDRRRRVLAGVGRGGRRAGRDQRLGAGAGGRRCRRAARPRARRGSRCAGRWSITTPGAVRSWGDAHARWGRLSRDAVLAAGDRAGRGGVPGLGRADRGGRDDRRRLRIGAVGPGARRDLAPERPARGAPASWSGSRRSPRPSARSPTRGSTRTTTATSASGSRPGSRRPARRPQRRRPPGDHGSTIGERRSPRPTAASGSRPTRPTAAAIVALQLLNVLARFEPPADGRGSTPAAGPTPSGSTSSSRRPSWPSPTATRPHRPGVRATSPSTHLLDDDRAAQLAARIDPRPRRPGAAPLPDARRRHDLAGRRRRRGQRGEPHPVERGRVRLAACSMPATGVHFQNRGASF